VRGIDTLRTPDENQHQDLADALAGRGWMRELDELVGRSSAERTPTPRSPRTVPPTSPAPMLRLYGTLCGTGPLAPFGLSAPAAGEIYNLTGGQVED
jgi:hypothetical protein